MGKRKFTISDIHGCFKTFKALLEKIGFSKEDELYLLGDYVDRGPYSKPLIDHIIQLQQDYNNVHCLLGNHEIMLLEGLNDIKSMQFWFRNGGEATLESFNALYTPDIPALYLDWFRALKYYFEVDEYILVHAGLNFMIDNPLSDQQAMLWIRRWYAQVDYDWLGDRIIVHGHTPTGLTEILECHENIEQNRHLVIDGGCVYKSRGLGDLIAFELTKRELFVQKNID